MKLSNISIVAWMLILLMGCETTWENPPIEEDEIKIYLMGNGSSIDDLGQQGMEVQVGDTLTLELQVSPVTEISYAWYDSDGNELLSGLTFTYVPTEAEDIKIYFTAVRDNGYERSVMFNLSAKDDGLVKASYGSWSTYSFTDSEENGVFEVNLTAYPYGDAINGVFGLAQSTLNAYSLCSTIVRFAPTGVIDVYKGDDTGSGSYTADTEYKYSKGGAYQISLAVDVTTQTYSVSVALAGEEPTTLATSYPFRAAAEQLYTWGIYCDAVEAGDGVLACRDVTITSISRSSTPIFEEVASFEMQEGDEVTTTIKVTDPNLLDIEVTAVDMPRFGTLYKSSTGYYEIIFQPYEDCDGCDIGTYPVTLLATNSAGYTSTLQFEVTVSGYQNTVEVSALVAYNVFEGGESQNTLTSLAVGNTLAPSGAMEDAVAVLTFELPEIDASQQIIEAQLIFTLEWNRAWQNVRYDLYSLGMRADSELLSTDYYALDAEQDADNTSRIEEGIVTNYSEGDGYTGEVTSSDEASLLLATVLNEQIARNAGNIAVLRVNANRDDIDNWVHLKISVPETATIRPRLVLTLGDKE